MFSIEELDKIKLALLNVSQRELDDDSVCEPCWHFVSIIKASEVGASLSFSLSFSFILSSVSPHSSLACSIPFLSTHLLNES